MAEDNKIYLPSSGGGLLRYSADSSKLKLNPKAIIAVIIIITIAEILLYKLF